MATLEDTPAGVYSPTAPSVTVTPNGDNRAVIAWVLQNSGSVPTPTCGGVAMTAINAAVPRNWFGLSFGVFVLTDPAAEAQTVAYSKSGYLGAAAISGYGSVRATALGSGSVGGGGGTATISSLTAESGDLMFGALSVKNGGTVVLTPGATQLFEGENIAGNSDSFNVQYDTANTTSESMSWDISKGALYGGIILSIQDAAAAPLEGVVLTRYNDIQ